MISFRWQNKTIQYHIVFHRIFICLQNETDQKAKDVIEFAMLSKLAVKYSLELTILVLLQTVNVTLPVQLCNS